MFVSYLFVSRRGMLKLVICLNILIHIYSVLSYDFLRDKDTFLL